MNNYLDDIVEYYDTIMFIENYALPRMRIEDQRLYGVTYMYLINHPDYTYDNADHFKNCAFEYVMQERRKELGDKAFNYHKNKLGKRRSYK